MKLHIVLHQPEIPQNTGNIARTCSALGASLHLVKPLGFSIDEKSVRRAGLDYWEELDLHEYDNIEDFFTANPEGLHIFATTKAERTYDSPDYPSYKEVFLIFGKESKGLPEELLVEHRENCVRIPMLGETRSLNLSNSVAIMAYEVMRQREFDFLKKEGKLHRLSWD